MNLHEKRKDEENMYILKNALISITRNKGRNLLIGMIVVVISCAVTVTLAIRSSATSLIKSYEEKYDVVATIGMNRESMRGSMKMDKDMSEEELEAKKEDMVDMFSMANSISSSDVETYADSEYVKDYYYTLVVGVNAESLEKASTEGMSGNDSMPPSFGGRGKEKFQNMTAGDFTLTGYSSLSAMEDFVNGKYSIVEGEVSSDLESMSCVMNLELASLNGVEVGDEITFVDPDNSKNTVTLTVTGIFEEKEETEDMMGMFTTSANTIITNTKVITKLSSTNEDMKTSLTPTFILASKDSISNFEEELQEKGLNEYLSVSTNLDQVESATSTVSNVHTFATTFLWITLVIGGIVLFVINMINIRERKYEIGVLRTIGMKKSYLTIQFISELLIVSLLALTAGGVLGSLSSVSVSNYLLENEIASSLEEKETVKQNFGGNMDHHGMDRVSGIAPVQAFDSMDAVVDTNVLLQLLGIGTVLTLLSSTASMISIQKFSPLTILKERS